MCDMGYGQALPSSYPSIDEVQINIMKALSTLQISHLGTTIGVVSLPPLLQKDVGSIAVPGGTQYGHHRNKMSALIWPMGKGFA